MKRILITALGMIMATSSFASETDVAWETDFKKAKEKAGKENLPILVNFSGSDWCGWCIKLHNEVFSREDFEKYAKNNVVLFLADFPMQSKLPEATANQNKELAEKYGVRGFPTVLLLDKDGKVLARTGYRAGGSAAYITHLKELVKTKK